MIRKYLQATADAPERASASNEHEIELSEGGVECGNIADTTDPPLFDISETNSSDTYPNTAPETELEFANIANAEGKGTICSDVRIL